MSIHLTVPPKRELKPRIVVFGIGGLVAMRSIIW